MLLKGSIIFYRMVLSVPNMRLTAPGEGKFLLRNAGNGRLLAPAGFNSGEGAPMETMPPQPRTAVVWNFRPQGNGQFILMNEMSGKTFAMAADRRAVQLPFSLDDLQGQYLKFILGENNRYYIQHPSGLVLTAGGQLPDHNAVLTFSECSRSVWQQWEVLPPPGMVWGRVADVAIT